MTAMLGAAELSSGTTNPLGLAELLDPIPVDRFLAEHLGERPLLVRGSPGKFAGLFSWHELNAALRATHLEWLSPEVEGTTPRDRVLLTVGGVSVDPTEFFSEVESLRRNRVRRIDPTRLAALCRRRATLLLREIDFLADGVGRLADRVERTLGAPLAVAALASWNETPGLSVHIDEQDSLILHLEGRKRWRVWEPTRIHPVHNDSILAPQPTGDPVLDIVLEPGDFLYVPRGWFHSVAALGGPTLHLTANLYASTGVDVLRWIVDELRDQLIVRRDLPRHDGERAMRERGRLLVTSLRDLVGDGEDIVERFLAAADASANPRRPTFGLPWSATPTGVSDDDEAGPVVRLLAPRGLVDLDVGSERVEFTVAGRRWSLDAVQFSALAPLLEGEPVPLDALRLRAEEVGESQLDGLLGDLVLSGVVAIEEPG